MPTRKNPTLAQVVEAVAAELNGPLPFDEFVQRILTRYESKAKNPAQLVRTNLRYELSDYTLVFRDPKTLVPLRVAMQDVRFRVPLDATQAQHGVLWYADWFTPFSGPIFSHSLGSDPPTFTDANAQPIPTRLVTLQAPPRRTRPFPRGDNGEP